MTWQQRYRRMADHYGWTGDRVAEITGNTKASIRTVTAPGAKQEFPRWLKLAVVVFEIENGLKEEAVMI